MYQEDRSCLENLNPLCSTLYQDLLKRISELVAAASYSDQPLTMATQPKSICAGNNSGCFKEWYHHWLAFSAQSVMIILYNINQLLII